MGCKLARMSCAGASAGMQQAVHCEQANGCIWLRVLP